MTLRTRIFALALGLLSTAAHAIDLRNSSVSTSRQFTIYCDEVRARMVVSSFAEETKARILWMIGDTDHWKYPVVINIERAEASQPERPLSEVAVFEMEEGMKICVNLWLRNNPADMRFPQELTRAILLEYMHRRNPVKAGQAYAEPPPWVVAGMCRYLANREPGANADVFKTLLDSGSTPSIAKFLAQNPAGADATSQKIYDACALSLVQLLIELPGGRASLGAYLREFGSQNAAPVAGLLRHFPALGQSAESLERWWALSMARISASDRYAGLSVEESERQLDALLTLEISDNKETKTYRLDEFAKFRKMRAAREVLKAKSRELVSFSIKANVLLRPALIDYQKILTDLQRGRTRDVAKRLASIAGSRSALLARITEIGDYLNWYEATQMTALSDAFKDANTFGERVADGVPAHTDRLTRYIDDMEQEFK